MAVAKTELSEDTKTIITVLCLLLAFPVGLLLMWIWTIWPNWVKVLLTSVLILPILLIIFTMVLLGTSDIAERKTEMKSKYQQQYNSQIYIKTPAPLRFNTN